MTRSTGENTTKMVIAITCLFLDISVLLTVGRNHHARRRKTTDFRLDGLRTVRVIPTDEEFMIAKTVYRVLDLCSKKEN